MDKLKSVLSRNDDEEDKGIVTQISDASTLSWSTRIKLFAVCFLLGVILSVLGSCLFFLKNGLTIFGILYTLGNILSLASTCFLMGPFNQIKTMFLVMRIVAALFVLLFFVLTLVCAFALKNGALTIVSCVLQFFALTWYSLTYIPYAGDMVKKFFASFLDLEHLPASS